MLGSFLLLHGLLEPADHVVDSEQHGRGLHGRLENLLFHHQRFPDVEVSHVADLSGHPVDPEHDPVGVGVFGSELGQHPDDVSPAVLGEGSGDDFEGVGEGAVGELALAFDEFGLLVQFVGEFHLGGASSGDHLGMDSEVLGDGESVL